MLGQNLLSVAIGMSVKKERAGRVEELMDAVRGVLRQLPQCAGFEPVFRQGDGSTIGSVVFIDRNSGEGRRSPVSLTLRSDGKVRIDIAIFLRKQIVEGVEAYILHVDAAGEAMPSSSPEFLESLAKALTAHPGVRPVPAPGVAVNRSTPDVYATLAQAIGESASGAHLVVNPAGSSPAEGQDEIAIELDGVRIATVRTVLGAVELFLGYACADSKIARVDQLEALAQAVRTHAFHEAPAPAPIF